LEESFSLQGLGIYWLRFLDRAPPSASSGQKRPISRDPLAASRELSFLKPFIQAVPGGLSEILPSSFPPTGHSRSGDSRVLKPSRSHVSNAHRIAACDRLLEEYLPPHEHSTGQTPRHSIETGGNGTGDSITSRFLEYSPVS